MHRQWDFHPTGTRHPHGHSSFGDKRATGPHPTIGVTPTSQPGSGDLVLGKGGMGPGTPGCSSDKDTSGSHGELGAGPEAPK